MRKGNNMAKLHLVMPMAGRCGRRDSSFDRPSMHTADSTASMMAAAYGKQVSKTELTS